MKRKIIILLITGTVLGLILTGCSDVEEIIEAVSNTEIEDVEEIIDTISNTEEDTDTEEDVEAEEDQAFTGEIEELAKYKVSYITDEGTNQGVYELHYNSEEQIDNIIEYFEALLEGTPDYVITNMPSIGAYFRGSINDKGVTVEIKYAEENDEILVSFFAYD